MKKLIQLTLLMVMAVSQAYAGNLDVKKSQLKWKGTKITGEHYGKISFKSGNVQVQDDKLVGGEFIVDIDSFTVDDLSGTWEKKFLKHIKSKDFFVVEKYPTAKLKIISVKGNNVTANLTIKGKTNPVSFKYTKDGDAFSGKFKFDRTKFGMIYGSGDFFKGLGDKVIHNDIQLEFKAVLK